MKTNNAVVPKVSVVMLAYNVGRYVETAIRGVLGQQTNYPVQLVIAEDCSTDDTRAICLRSKERYPDRITLLLHERNMGLQRNFMDAHRHCTGEYIAICDGDDYWFDRRKLQRMTDFMDTHPRYAICFHRVINFYEEDRSKSLSNGGQRTVTTLLDLARSNYITNSSSLFRRNYYVTLPGWFADITSCDYAMHVLNAQHGDIYYFRCPMAVYRKHAQGVWSEAKTAKMLMTALDVREKLLDYFGNGRIDVYDALRQSHTEICLNLLRYYHTDTATSHTEDICQAEQRLLAYRPEWTLVHLHEAERQRAAQESKNLKSAFFNGLRQCRRIISRLLPLPRVGNVCQTSDRNLE